MGVVACEKVVSEGGSMRYPGKPMVQVCERVENTRYLKSAMEAYQDALEAGDSIDMVWGDDYTLTVDLDTPEAQKEFDRRLRSLQEYMVVSVLDSWESRHGGEHVVLKLHQRMGFRDRAAVQAFLGSDPLREMLGWLDVNNQPKEDPFVLFKPRR